MIKLKIVFPACVLVAFAGCGGSTSSEIASPSQISQSAKIAMHAAQTENELVLPNDRAQYLITSTAAVYTIASLPDDGSSRTINALRRIQFADTSLALDLEYSSQIYRLYQAAFDRKPDLAGLGYWLGALDEGMPLEQIATGFIANAEFQQLYGANPTNQQFLTKLYSNILHRAPDTAGLNYWLDAMQSGLSKATVLIEFSNSAENKSAVNPVIQQGIFYAKSGVAYRPVANAGSNAQVAVGSKVTLDGSGSTDANGDALNFIWSLYSKPETSKATMSADNAEKPFFTADFAGEYRFALTVKDTALSSRVSVVIITAVGATAPTIPITPVADTGIYKCSQISAAMAQLLYSSGHTYLDRDHDGKPCEANDIVVENQTALPPSTPVGKQCWVNGYTRKNGTYVHGYYRSC